MLEPHMLSHWAFSSIWFLAIGYRAYKLPLYLICTSPEPSFLILSRWIFILFYLCNHHLKFLYLSIDCIELNVQNIVGKVKLFGLFLIEKGSILKLIIEQMNLYRSIFGKLVIVPLRIALKLIFLSSKQTLLNLFLNYFTHLLTFSDNIIKHKKLHKNDLNLIANIQSKAFGK